jgi:signal transduction histidine kinase
VDTYFDIAEKNSVTILKDKIETINNSSLMKVFLTSISGLLAILDEHRQMVSLNENYLRVLGMDDPRQVLGLRTGEALECIHAKEYPNGCGTTKFCKSCGAAIAIATSLAENRLVEKNCAIQMRKKGKESDLFLSVKCEPIVIDDTRFLLVFLRDITKEHQRSILERTFFHDINNMIGGLAMANLLLSQGSYNERLVTIIDTCTKSLVKEVETQQCLMFNDMHYYKPANDAVSANTIFIDLDNLYHNHPAKDNKNLIFEYNENESILFTDEALLLRILANMITNALEATETGGLVRLWWENTREGVRFTVHNESYIEKDLQLRIFQRNFTTKKQLNRGIGTYSMKLFGETMLQGKVGFQSTEEKGTHFFITIPVNISN